MMTNRITKIITRSGDNGTTGLADGSRVSKGSFRIDAIGDVDELNSIIGLLLCEISSKEIRQEVLMIQNELFNIGGELALPGQVFIGDDQIEKIEQIAEKYNSPLPPLKEFILPGGSRSAALFHVARSVCRRAERSVVSLSEVEEVSKPLRMYLNRLSDLFFIYARVVNKEEKKPDVLWQKPV